jgi:hypothetical protein
MDVLAAKEAAHSNPTSSTESQQTAGSPRRHGQHAYDMQAPAQQNSLTISDYPWSNTQPVDSPEELPASVNSSLAKLLIKQQLSSLTSSQLAELQQQLRQQRLQRAQESLCMPMMVPSAEVAAVPALGFAKFSSVQEAAAAAAVSHHFGSLDRRALLTSMAAAVQAAAGISRVSCLSVGRSVGNAALHNTEDVLAAASRALSVIATSSTVAPAATVDQQHQKLPVPHHEQPPARQWPQLQQYNTLPPLQHLNRLMEAAPVSARPAGSPAAAAAAVSVFAGSSAAADGFSRLSKAAGGPAAAGGTAAMPVTCCAQLTVEGSSEHTVGLQQQQHPGIPGSRGQRSRGSRGRASAIKLAAAMTSAFGHEGNVHHLHRQQQVMEGCTATADSSRLPTAGSVEASGGAPATKAECALPAGMADMLQEADRQSSPQQQQRQAQALLMAAAAGPVNDMSAQAAVTEDLLQASRVGGGRQPIISCLLQMCLWGPHIATYCHILPHIATYLTPAVAAGDLF